MIKIIDMSEEVCAKNNIAIWDTVRDRFLVNSNGDQVSDVDEWLKSGTKITEHATNAVKRYKEGTIKAKIVAQQISDMEVEEHRREVESW